MAYAEVLRIFKIVAIALAVVIVTSIALVRYTAFLANQSVQEFAAKGINSKLLEFADSAVKNEPETLDGYEIGGAFPKSETLAGFRQIMLDGGFTCFASHASPPRFVSCKIRIPGRHIACPERLIIKALFDQSWLLESARARFTCYGL